MDALRSWALTQVYLQNCHTPSFCFTDRFLYSVLISQGSSFGLIIPTGINRTAAAILASAASFAKQQCGLLDKAGAGSQEYERQPSSCHEPLLRAHSSPSVSSQTLKACPSWALVNTGDLVSARCSGLRQHRGWCPWKEPRSPVAPAGSGSLRIPALPFADGSDL